MITEEQWQALHLYVTEKIKTDDKFGLRDSTLAQMFGITHPFWKEMCKYAENTDQEYKAVPHWLDSNEEPSEIEYRRRA